jgi:hypothetical protein
VLSSRSRRIPTTPTATAGPANTATASAPATSTASGTSTPTPAPTLGIAGAVRHHASGEPIGGAVMHLSGPAPAEATTDALGRFAFADLAGGDWLLVPSKLGGENGAVSAFDAAYVLQAVRETRTLTPLQRLAADVSGDGELDDFDVLLILRRSVGLDGRFPVAQACGSDWLFVPAAAPVPNQEVLTPGIASGACQSGGVRYSPLANAATDQDFDGVPFGDPTGNWQDPG